MTNIKRHIQNQHPVQWKILENQLNLKKLSKRSREEDKDDDVQMKCKTKVARNNLFEKTVPIWQLPDQPTI